MRQLAIQSGYSVSTLRRLIGYWLGRSPADRDIAHGSHFIWDSTNFNRGEWVVAVMDSQSFRVVRGVYSDRWQRVSLGSFCKELVRDGLYPRSATVDGDPVLIKTLRSFWPQIIIQRCLVHIQRQGLRWCRRHPSRTDAKRLRQLFLRVTSIRSLAEKEYFLRQVLDWERRHGVKIAVLPEKGWVFSDLKRARSMLIAALPDMFHYLSNNLIATSTNALEGYFGRLKQRYRQHRGLASKNRPAYFQWYLKYSPK